MNCESGTEGLRHVPEARGEQPCSLKNTRGQAMVEFALVLPILCTLVFAAIEFGDAYWKYQQLSAAVSEGARKAIVSRSDVDRTSTITTAVHNAAPNLDPDLLDVNVSSDTWNPGDSVSVTGDYPEVIRIVGVPVFNGDLSNTRTMRIEQ